MLQIRISILLMLLGEAYMLFPKTYEVRFISINSSGFEYIDYRKVRFLGRERRANGTVDLKYDLDNTLYSISAESFNDPNGNGDYKQLPMFIPRLPVCKAMDSYWKLAEASLKYGVNTNMPIHTRPCPIPKGTYYFKDVLIHTDDWPAIMPRGFLKGVATLFRKSEAVSTLEIVAQITDLS